MFRTSVIYTLAFLYGLHVNGKDVKNTFNVSIRMPNVVSTKASITYGVDYLCVPLFNNV